MQSLGEILSNARNEKGYSIDQVAHETNISRNYIQLLESENFEQFPAEAYLIGFLRNYSDYLSLDAERMIALYRNHKLSEEPSPIEELVGKKRSSSALPLLIGVIVVLVGFLIFAGIKWLPKIQAGMEEKRIARAEEESKRSPQNYSVDEEIAEFRILEGDSISFTQGEQTFRFLLIDEEDHFVMDLTDSVAGESHSYPLRLKEEIFLSLFRDTPDYRLVLDDYGLSTGEAVLIVQQLAVQEEIEKVEEEIPTLSEVAEELPAGQNIRQENSSVILTLPAPERFTVEIIFRGYSLYRYEQDNRERDERYYRDGDVFRIDVNRKIQLWVSNAGAAYTKVNGVEVNLGRNGQVTVKSIQWIKNDQGSYDLVLLPVY